jgi:hypothetical protein
VQHHSSLFLGSGSVELVLLSGGFFIVLLEYTHILFLDDTSSPIPILILEVVLKD